MTNQIAMIERSFDRLITPALRSMNTAIPGVIEAYDPKTKTAKCSVTISDFIEGDGGEMVEQEWPPLEETPVWFPGGSVFADLFPLKAGDPCLLIFCQRDIAEWFLSNGKEPVSPADLEHHNESSAICLPRLFPEGKNDGEAHADNWVSWFGNGKKRVIEPNGKMASYVVDRFNVGSEDAAKALAIAEYVLDALNELKSTVNEICVNSTANGGLVIPPVLPILTNWTIDSKKSFVSE